MAAAITSSSVNAYTIPKLAYTSVATGAGGSVPFFGPITTLWTVPKSCVDATTFIQTSGAFWVYDLVPGDDPNCNPPVLYANGYPSSPPAYKQLEYITGIYSPATCPSGWYTVEVNQAFFGTITKDGLIFACCPSGYTFEAHCESLLISGAPMTNLWTGKLPLVESTTVPYSYATLLAEAIYIRPGLGMESTAASTTASSEGSSDDAVHHKYREYADQFTIIIKGN